jgi:hypothetical protein
MGSPGVDRYAQQFWGICYIDDAAARRQVDGQGESLYFHITEERRFYSASAFAPFAPSRSRPAGSGHITPSKSRASSCRGLRLIACTEATRRATARRYDHSLAVPVRCSISAMR